MSSKFMKRLGLCVSVAVLMFAASGVEAQTIKVAVAANFQAPLNKLITAYQNSGQSYSGASFTVTSGATGDFKTEIVSVLSAGSATPYDLFLSADDETPTSLYVSYPSVVQAPFFYAEGKLVLWSKYGPNVGSSGYAGFPNPASYVYANGQVAIANPTTAPYGNAAKQVLSRMYSIAYPGGAYDRIFTQYTTIGTTYNAIVASTGSSSAPNMGFIAKSQICSNGAIVTPLTGTYYEYTQTSANGSAPHDRILQDGVAIRGRSGASAAAVDQFISFIKSTSGKAIITSYCYGVTG
ncbi:substrate-binding domain-containing protein [Uliginosibacterium gangwonense]|uniref:substrate-binding domain-containing protein n=1 Tax=Uliginosibacterium gangwonense TaxID=392736 RepID=UPI0003A43E16|nr:substrate-binding domain-containing protein [Uliginosibacterium gangwonense]